jgi:hypothetical protein
VASDNLLRTKEQVKLEPQGVEEAATGVHYLLLTNQRESWSQ